ncbi:MAG: OmpA family protein, partial [Bacteroidia bacterium]
GYDIFLARKDDKGEWMEPENIGEPINGPTDDTGFFVSSDAKTGYFFSYDEGKVRGRGVGRYDLYSFDLYPEARPQSMTFMKGTIKDEKGEPISGAVLEIKNTVTKEKTYATVDSTTGQYMAAISLKKKDNIVMTVKKDSIAFNSVVVDVKNASYYSPPADVKLVVAKAEKGKSFVINNILYNTNSAEIKEESKLILESFADYLKENPDIKVEIQGHTDNVGNPKDNLALSTNRAFSIKQLLEEYKIDGNRITAKGYGQDKPIADNKTENGRAKNRRTEFLIVE